MSGKWNQDRIDKMVATRRANREAKQQAVEIPLDSIPMPTKATKSSAKKYPQSNDRVALAREIIALVSRLTQQ
jgi:hypothetical protein